ncbi:MAG: hypothetical protein AVDCRST_MAG88-3500 [uncultured Thermomicrobiales bacterium]|uniref:Uncharacterized protein n=1 Tax=uncultured Thermomicrobiales bacterium TaxID=1645740 RepID=A0A6J4VML2_9BACT|nr:MAG: hypothetical protein AVDCRST_MAG88-3500 [uncultured Thermomicrobiales bacterium]
MAARQLLAPLLAHLARYPRPPLVPDGPAVGRRRCTLSGHTGRV